MRYARNPQEARGSFHRPAYLQACGMRLFPCQLCVRVKMRVERFLFRTLPQTHREEISSLLSVRTYKQQNQNSQAPYSWQSIPSVLLLSSEDAEKKNPQHLYICALCDEFSQCLQFCEPRA